MLSDHLEIKKDYSMPIITTDKEVMRKCPAYNDSVVLNKDQGIIAFTRHKENKVSIGRFSSDAVFEETASFTVPCEESRRLSQLIKSPDGHQLATVEYSLASPWIMRIWEWQSEKVVQKNKLELMAGAYKFALTEGAEMLIFLKTSFTHPNQLYFWDMENNLRFIETEENIDTLFVSSNGKIITSGKLREAPLRRVIKIWDKDANILHTIEVNDQRNICEISGNQLLISTIEKIFIWDLENYNLVAEFKHYLHNEHDIQPLPDGKIAVKNNNYLVLIDIALQNILLDKPITNNTDRFTCALTKDRNIAIIYFSYVGIMHFHDTKTLQSEETRNLDLNKTDDKGNTVLHLAVMQKSFNMVKYYVERCAKLDAKNKRGDTALHLAIDLPALNIAQYLIQQGTNLATKNRLGNNAYSLFSYLYFDPDNPKILPEQIQTAQSLINHGGCINAEIADLMDAHEMPLSSYDLTNCLFLGATYHGVPITRELLGQLAITNLNELHEAVRTGKVDYIKMRNSLIDAVAEYPENQILKPALKTVNNFSNLNLTARCFLFAADHAKNPALTKRELPTELASQLPLIKRHLQGQTVVAKKSI